MNEIDYSATFIWLTAGLALIALELIVPGAFVFFFGVAALLTGLAVYLDLIVTTQNQLLFWAFTSMLLVLLLRQQLKKYFPSIVKYDYQDDASEITNQQVQVTHDISFDHTEGRVKFQGSSYQARTQSGTIKAGENAIIVERENLVLIVKRPEK